jgi:hypothetical protein
MLPGNQGVFQLLKEVTFRRNLEFCKSEKWGIFGVLRAHAGSTEIINISPELVQRHQLTKPFANTDYSCGHTPDVLGSNCSFAIISTSAMLTTQHIATLTGSSLRN